MCEHTCFLLLFNKTHSTSLLSCSIISNQASFREPELLLSLLVWYWDSSLSNKESWQLKQSMFLTKLSSTKALRLLATADSSGVSFNIWMLCFFIRCSMINWESETGSPSSSVIQGDLPLGPIAFLNSLEQNDIINNLTNCWYSLRKMKCKGDLNNGQVYF